MRKIARFLRIILVLFFCNAAISQIYVIDTDTFIYNGEKIRLMNIDGLERNQHTFEYTTTQYVRKCLKSAKNIEIRRIGIEFLPKFST